MEYAKPEISLVASAIDAVQGSTMKLAVPIDSIQQSTASAYESDE